MMKAPLLFHPGKLWSVSWGTVLAYLFLFLFLFFQRKQENYNKNIKEKLSEYCTILECSMYISINSTQNVPATIV